MMTEYQGFKYKIRARLDGRYLFAVWWADADSRRDEPIWVKTVARKAAAERGVKHSIDDRQPKPRRASCFRIWDCERLGRSSALSKVVRRRATLSSQARESFNP